MGNLICLAEMIHLQRKRADNVNQQNGNTLIDNQINPKKHRNTNNYKNGQVINKT